MMLEFLSKAIKIKMDSKVTHLRQNLDTIITFLTPYLPLANCHMVEFFTQSHWDRLLPSDLQHYLDKSNLLDAVNIFWKASEKNNLYSENEISKWVETTRNHCLINNEYCLNPQGLQKLIISQGSNMQPELKITEFMNSKKSYEVQSMSAYVASLHNLCGATHCVEAGGGKGHLLVALSLGYQIPSLTIDCDEKTLRNAEKRVKIIQKQWHAIAKKINKNSEVKMSNIDSELHRFAPAFITKDTDLTEVVQNQFKCETVKLLLTGLHTCGNLGPDSLRLFTTHQNVGALFNVPCCYHLLSEEVDGGLYDVFQRDYGGVGDSYGFPMSEHLRGFNLGRNARMLAAQSIERVTARKELPNRSLLYRALLQEIIKNHSPESTIKEGKLKGISCQSFEEYLKTADAILNIGLDSCQIPETTIDCQWKKIVLFYLIRLCLAQVVESVILMDRLLFLYENGFTNVFLVKLFDPVLSPRCHSIVAIR
ncbi:probable methyltransferase-like protein 25 isoform X1 [Pieris brassicae]|uniref:probable methyltransferase-like protein 25 isoform X1 n=1 Tax=Pieris brassicae TaxID=7116 RepID=UPI001E6602D5|nr:probable methyltransferase-like protein 25 isoform X1 [Pieris brassicae]